jgi:hypothetical protein
MLRCGADRLAFERKLVLSKWSRQTYANAAVAEVNLGGVPPWLPFAGRLHTKNITA